MIVNDKEGRKYLDAVRNGSFKLGLDTGCALDNHLRYKKNNFNIIAGHANVGKTKWILYYYLLLSLKHGLRWCFYSAENELGDIKADLLELMEVQKLQDLTQLRYESSLQWVNEHFKFIDHEEFFTKHKRMMSYKDILKAFSETDLDGLVIDPYNSLAKDGSTLNGHEYDYMVASELRMYCKMNNKCIYILAHGNTEALRKKYGKEHDYHGHPIPLSASDIEGGGKWVNRCDDFIVIHRMTQHPSNWMNTEIHVRKVKSTRTGGTPTMIDEPVIFKLEKGLYFTVNGQNPIDKPAPKDKPLPLNVEFDNEEAPF